MTLNGKVVLITGANGGLGASVTNAFLNAGARVIGVSRSIKDSDFPNPNFSARATELAGGDAARALVAEIGRVDVLVHLVGAFAGGQPVADTDDATVEKMLDLNFKSAFHMIRAVLPGMRERRAGRILAIGSKAAVEPAPMAAAYAASKAALVSLIRTVARENLEQGIAANIVLPGTMDTPANRAAMPAEDPAKWVQPEQVAALLVHLAADDASQVSGAAIPVYGSEA